MRLTVEPGFSKSYAKIIRVGIYLRILTGIDRYASIAGQSVSAVLAATAPR
jgi:hypothetical protein